MTVKKLRPSALLPKLTENKKYIKKIKFIAKKKEAAAAAERGRSSLNRKQSKKRVKRSGKGAKKEKKNIESNAKKSSLATVKGKKKTGLVTSGVKKVSKKNKKATSEKEAPSDNTPQPENPEATKKNMSQAEIDKTLIERAIRGEEEIYNTSAAASAVAAGVEFGELLQHSCLPFLEDYVAQKRSELVSADTLLQGAHEYFKDLGKRESAMRRAAAKRLRELKEINRRGGDKDGFRYVVPRNVKEVVRQMSQQQQAVEDVDTSNLTSTFREDHIQEAEEKPMHRRRRKNSCYSDFYQFQVSKRWTRNAENFLNKGRAHKSMFGAARQQRSLKKF
ncbi:Ribosomal RNA-processing protein 7 [Trypanosoma melophagium]|uniref:Ribosomal RNA-processing protein 7 n=1 Tax=Trypanosoma melophagium TaxID=715481 RepID=UPI00351A2F04|nr:Ribosomal RNA-processing protein 7 [Trypanosoma melophagium]